MTSQKARRLTAEAIAAGFPVIAQPRSEGDWYVEVSINPDERPSRFAAYGQWEDWQRRGSYFTHRRNYECCDRCHAEDLDDCTCPDGPRVDGPRVGGQ